MPTAGRKDAETMEERQLIAAWQQSSADLLRRTEEHLALRQRVQNVMAGAAELAVDGVVVATSQASARWSAAEAEKVLAQLYPTGIPASFYDQPKPAKPALSATKARALLTPELYALCQREGDADLKMVYGD